MRGSVFVTVDSRDRESPLDHPGEYTVRLLEDVRDVCAIKVRSTDIPPMWNVPVGRSSVWVAVAGGPLVEAVVQPANYTVAGAVAAVKAALDASTAQTWTVSVDGAGRFVLATAVAFVVRGGDGKHRDGYGPRALGRVLGLAPGPVSSVAGSLTARYAHQLDRADTMYLHIEDFDAVHGATSGLHNCTDVINANGGEHEIPAEKHFHPPLSRLNRLRVRITDYYGIPVDFDNRENRVDLQFFVGDAARRMGRGFSPARPGDF